MNHPRTRQPDGTPHPPDVANSAPRTKGRTIEQPGVFQQSDALWSNWTVRSLLVGTAPISATSFAGGSLSWRFSGKGDKGGYDRVFTTAVGEVLQLDVGMFRSWSLELQRIPAGRRLRGWVCASEGPITGSRPSRSLVAEQYDAGTWSIPPGATKLYPAAPAASFTWQNTTRAGVTLTIAEPLTVGQELEVKGTHFSITGKADLVWELWL